MKKSSFFIKNHKNSTPLVICLMNSEKNASFKIFQKKIYPNYFTYFNEKHTLHLTTSFKMVYLNTEI